MELSELKNATGLSGKQWDKGMKGLSKHAIARVNKVEGQLLVELAI